MPLTSHHIAGLDLDALPTHVLAGSFPITTR